MFDPFTQATLLDGSADAVRSTGRRSGTFHCDIRVCWSALWYLRVNYDIRVNRPGWVVNQPGPKTETGQDEHVLSMVCSADFSEDCSLRFQWYFVWIHILE